MKSLAHNEHFIGVCEIKTFLQKKILRADDFQPARTSRHCRVSFCCRLAEHLLDSRGCPGVRPPPLGELFLEMGIIVKLCWCPFSLSLTSPGPWGELTPQVPAMQGKDGGRGSHIPGRMGRVLPSISPQPRSQLIGPIHQERTPRRREDKRLARPGSSSHCR